MMVCPTCRTEYVEGISECADCRVPLACEVNEAPPAAECAATPAEAELKKVFETWDSYEFLDAAEALRKAGIPFMGDEFYYDELRVGRREQAPYLWALLVPEEKAAEALKILGEKVSGEPVCFPPPAAEPMTSRQRWILLGVVVVAVIFFMIARR